MKVRFVTPFCYYDACLDCSDELSFELRIGYNFCGRESEKKLWQVFIATISLQFFFSSLQQKRFIKNIYASILNVLAAFYHFCFSFLLPFGCFFLHPYSYIDNSNYTFNVVPTKICKISY